MKISTKPETGLAKKTATAQKKLLISIPAYNEEENIGGVLDSILLSVREWTADSHLRGISDSYDTSLALDDISVPGHIDILVIDDGSSDKTREVCLEKDVMVISHIYNMGYGAALKTAYKYAADRDYDYIIQMDADGQHEVSNIRRLYQVMTADPSLPPDIVIGSRFLQNSVSFHIPFYKKAVIAIFKFLIKLATGKKITDPTSGLQGLSRDAFTFYARFNQFAIDYPDANMIVQMALNNFMVEEVPAVMLPRKKGTSMHSGIYKPLKYIFKMTLSVIIICLREMIFKKKPKKAETAVAGLTQM